MAKLSDAQLVILSAAAKRDDGAVVLPEKLKGSAATKVVDSLIGRELIKEIRRSGELPVWRTDEDERKFSLRITAKGLAEIGIEPEGSAPEAEAKAPKSAAAP